MSETQIVCAEGIVSAPVDIVFEQIANPSLQPAWDGNDNLQTAAKGQRVHAVGDTFDVTLTHDLQVRRNRVVEFEEGRLIAWLPSPVDADPPGHLWRWELEPLQDGTTRVVHTYDWTNLHDASRVAKARRTTSERLQASIDRLAALFA